MNSASGPSRWRDRTRQELKAFFALRKGRRTRGGKWNRQNPSHNAKVIKIGGLHRVIFHGEEEEVINEGRRKLECFLVELITKGRHFAPWHKTWHEHQLAGDTRKPVPRQCAQEAGQPHNLILGDRWHRYEIFRAPNILRERRRSCSKDWLIIVQVLNHTSANAAPAYILASPPTLAGAQAAYDARNPSRVGEVRGDAWNLSSSTIV
jgi:hypothetical protein